MSKPNDILVPKEPEEFWEEYESDEDGICMACKEHSSPLWRKHVITGEIDKDDEMSICCGAGIWTP